jgi:hypothetical protein
MKNMRNIFIPAIVLLFILSSCSKSSGDKTTGNTGGGGNNPPPLDCTNVPKSFTIDVNPIIQAFCNAAGCHASGSVNGPGPITNYNQVFNAQVSIRSAIATGAMPQNSTLTTAQKNSILCWIDAGATDN